MSKVKIACVACGLVMTFSQALAGSERIPDYEQARAVFWHVLYANGGETLYCGVPFTSGDRRRGLNIEHVFPMGWALRPFGCKTRKGCRAKQAQFNRIEADLHNLFPSRVDINNERGAAAFGLIDGEQRRFGACDFEVRGRRVEPREEVRGEIARAMLYMHDSYAQLTIFKKAAKMLLRWHREDPPSDVERRRNDLIEQIQGNRNPFIDTPEKADALVF